MPEATDDDSGSYYKIDPNASLLQKERKKFAEFPFDAMKAYKTRLQAFANGAIYVVLHDPALSLSHEAKRYKIAAIRALTDAKITEANRVLGEPGGALLFHELKQFNQSLAKASGLTIKTIALGEAFWAWQIYPRDDRVRITNSKHYDQQNKRTLTITQQDESFHAPLTSSQKETLLQIHQPSHEPEWFRALAPWAQSALKTIVPKEDGEDVWVNYQKTIPATLRCIPGQSNATKHTITISHNGTVLSTSTSYKQGVPTPFDIPTANTREQANENVAQLLNALQPNDFFKTYWGLSDAEMAEIQHKPPVLLGGLLTPKSQGGFLVNILDTLGLSGKENNTRMIEEKTNALQVYRQNSERQDAAEYFDINVAVNGQRRSSPLRVQPEFLNHAEAIHHELITVVNQTYARNQNQATYDDRIKRLSRLDAAITALKTHDASEQATGRNKNLHLAALYDATTQLMGGSATGHCKSSKDRKGVETIMVDAMMVYYEKHGAFPNHNDTGEKREDFVNVFVELYNSGHALLLAQDNSPGSVGIKDEGILDRDIIDALEAKNGSYKQSKEIAEFNKPKTFFDKHHKKGQRVLNALALVATLVTILLLATGVLAPAALLPGIIAVQLGALPILAGILSGAIAAIGSMFTAGLLYTGIKVYMKRNEKTDALSNSGYVNGKSDAWEPFVNRSVAKEERYFYEDIIQRDNDTMMFINGKSLLTWLTEDGVFTAHDLANSEGSEDTENRIKKKVDDILKNELLSQMDESQKQACCDALKAHLHQVGPGYFAANSIGYELQAHVLYPSPQIYKEAHYTQLSNGTICIQSMAWTNQLESHQEGLSDNYPLITSQSDAPLIYGTTTTIVSFPQNSLNNSSTPTIHAKMSNPVGTLTWNRTVEKIDAAASDRDKVRRNIEQFMMENEDKSELNNRTARRRGNSTSSQPSACSATLFNHTTHDHARSSERQSEDHATPSQVNDDHTTHASQTTRQSHP